MQAVMQLMQDPTINYNRIEGHRRMLNLLNVPEIDRLLPEPPRPKKADPVQENMMCVTGIPLKAFPDQDHLAHIEVHLRFILSPLLGGGPAYAGPQLGPLLGHITEHLTLYYPQMVAQTQTVAVMQGLLLPDATPERTMAVGMAGFDQTQMQKLQPLLQMLQQAQQLVQSKMPPPPMDPQAQVTMQVAQMEDARAKMQMQADQQLAQAKMQGDAAKGQAEMQLKQQTIMHSQKMDETKLQIDHQISMMQAQQDARMKEMDQQVSLMKNDADNKQKQMTELRKNEQDGLVNVLIATIREESAKQAASRETVAPQVGIVDESLVKMQNMLETLEKAQSQDALATMTQALKEMLSSQSAHQERTLLLANQLLQSE